MLTAASSPGVHAPLLLVAGPSYAAAGALALFLFLACALLLERDRRRGGAWSRRLTGEASPEALAALRVVVLVIALLQVAIEDLPSTSRIPGSLLLFQGKGAMSVFARVPGYAAFAASHTALLTFEGTLLAVLALGAVGLGARVILPLSFVGYLLHGGLLRQYTHYFHQGMLPLYLLAILAVTPCADAWSLDAWLRRRRGLPARAHATAMYGAARWAVFAVIGVSYFAAAFAKLRNGGLLWFGPTNMRSKLLTAAMEHKLDLPTTAPLAHLPDALVSAMGLGALLIEAAAIAILFSRRSRPLLAPLLLAMHLGILFAQEILFVDLLLLPIVLLQPHHLARAVGALLRGSPESARAHLSAAFVESGFQRPRWTPDVPPPGGGCVHGGEDSGGDGAGTPKKDWGGRAPVMIVAAVAAYLSPILFAIEVYPLTAWPMYSNTYPTREIQYVDFQAVRADGTTERARGDRDIPALRDNRFFDPIHAYLDDPGPVTRRRLDDFLTRAMALRNTHAPPEPPIVGYVIEQKRWDWGQSPGDPGQARTVESYTFPAPPPP